MIFKRLRSQQGLAAFIALMVMLMMTLIGVATLKISNDEINIAGNELNEMTAFYAAEAGLEQASAVIQDYYVINRKPPTNLPAGNERLSNDAVATYVTKDMGAAVQKRLTSGSLAGLNATVKTYRIESIGTSMVSGGQMRLSQDFNCALVPLFQFAVFYDNDLEIAPGPDMTLTGRVHTNGDLYLQANSNLYIDSYVSSASNLLHGQKGGGGVSTGDVYIKDIHGNYQSMKNTDGTFLSSSSTNWYDSAAYRWGGRVRDAAFGQEELNLPLADDDNPYSLIERGSGNPDSYENKADLKIIDGQAYVQIAGIWTNISGTLPAGAITTGSFTDLREGCNVNSTDIDISLLKTSSYYPTNGVIYASDQRSGSFNTVRLINGSNIGTGLSFYSENPMYVQGDFNTVDKKPAALAADAITFLSNNWSDALSAVGIDSRIASETTCNASIMAGNTNTTSLNYNGGLENLPRFLEKWSNVKFKYTGSLTNMWNSRQAISPWSYGLYYTAPIRDWAYDTDLDDPTKLPPMTPQIQVFQRAGWRQQHVGYTLNEADSSLWDTTTIQ